MITCHNLNKSYPSAKQGEVTALQNVTFSVTDGEFVCLVGPSGCGKTTLLKIVAGILQPTAGELTLDSCERAMVFQEHGVFPWLTVLDNVAFGLETQGINRRERQQRAMAFIEMMGLASFAKAYPHELSVGMRQRVGIARAFLVNPHILLMDEPFAALDAQTKLVLQEELLQIWTTQRNVVLYITHDLDEALLLADRILVMSGRPGRIQADLRVPLGRPRDVSMLGQADLTEMKWRIWKMLESDVRQSLAH